MDTFFALLFFVLVGLVVWLLSLFVQAPLPAPTLQPTPTAIVVPCDAPDRVCAQPIGGVTPLGELLAE